MNHTQQIKKYGATWVRRQDFSLFGTATFKNGGKITDTKAIADAKHFFNILDRQILTRKQLSKGDRLERMVFLEHGRHRTNTHIHFLIKGKCWRDYKIIWSISEEIWQQRIANAHDLLIKDNLGLDDTRSEYCWKELALNNQDVLLLECCHLNKH
jgi:hypothetical protein